MLDTTLLFVVIIIAVALGFDFVNGFHDAANSIATVVSTGVLRPTQAVVFAAFFNLIAIFVFHLSVAATVGKGIVMPGVVNMIAIDAASGAMKTLDNVPAAPAKAPAAKGAAPAATGRSSSSWGPGRSQPRPPPR